MHHLPSIINIDPRQNCLALTERLFITSDFEIDRKYLTDDEKI